MWVYTRDAWIPEAFPAREKSHNTRVNVHTTTRDNRYYGTVSARSEYSNTLTRFQAYMTPYWGEPVHTDSRTHKGHSGHTDTRNTRGQESMSFVSHENETPSRRGQRLFSERSVYQYNVQVTRPLRQCAAWQCFVW